MLENVLKYSNMKVYMKREHEIFVERYKGIREKIIVIFYGNYLGKTPMGTKKNS